MGTPSRLRNIVWEGNGALLSCSAICMSQVALSSVVCARCRISSDWVLDRYGWWRCHLCHTRRTWPAHHFHQFASFPRKTHCTGDVLHRFSVLDDVPLLANVHEYVQDSTDVDGQVGDKENNRIGGGIIISNKAFECSRDPRNNRNNHVQTNSRWEGLCKRFIALIYAI